MGARTLTRIIPKGENQEIDFLRDKIYKLNDEINQKNQIIEFLKGQLEMKDRESIQQSIHYINNPPTIKKITICGKCKEQNE